MNKWAKNHRFKFVIYATNTGITVGQVAIKYQQWEMKHQSERNFYASINDLPDILLLNNQLTYTAKIVRCDIVPKNAIFVSDATIYARLAEEAQ